ncbi:MAG TPA: hypothetical protein VLG09_00035 [Candidatus Saccharimonadales bacterium]|nr:hypothetical protein [Candidatus Saccharimonadales bacterium]
MNILRRLGLRIARLLFSSSLSLIIIIISIFFVFETSKPLKQALQKSGIYGASISDTIAEQKNTVAIPTTDPGIQQALATALPPTFLQSSTEQIIDGTYSWVHRDTSEPTFSIDLTSSKQRFADALAAYVQQRLDTLPTCTQVMYAPTTVEALLALSCMPYGTTSAEVAANVREQALASNVFPANNTLDNSTLRDGQDRPLSDQLAFIPQAHDYFIISLYTLPLIAILLAIAILFWSESKRSGLKRIAWLLILAGLTSVILAAAGLWLLQTGISLFGPSVVSTLQGKLYTLAELLFTDLRVWWFILGGGYIVLGITLLIILKFHPVKPVLALGRDEDFTPQAPSTDPFIDSDLLKPIDNDKVAK